MKTELDIMQQAPVALGMFSKRLWSMLRDFGSEKSKEVRRRAMDPKVLLVLCSSILTVQKAKWIVDDF